MTERAPLSDFEKHAFMLAVVAERQVEWSSFRTKSLFNLLIMLALVIALAIFAPLWVTWPLIAVCLYGVGHIILMIASGVRVKHLRDMAALLADRVRIDLDLRRQQSASVERAISRAERLEAKSK